MTTSRTRPRIGRKLLVASLGVAAVNYAYACGSTTVGNLVATPQDGSDSPIDGPQEALVANLAPPPQDSGLDSNTSDAAKKDAAADSSGD